MVDKIIDRRKSQLFLHNISPVTNSYDELVKENLTCGKFPTTKTGIIKMLGLSFLVGGFISYIFSSEPCQDEFYSYFFFISTGVITLGEFTLFLIFSFGLTVKHPAKWIALDIVFDLLASLFAIAASSLSMKLCSTNDIVNKMTGTLSIIGSATLFFSCAALFLMYRYVTYEDENELPQPRPLKDARKSIFA
ncbi:uncharacterized protein LOC132704371 [Cylas formicarius]|uniref:uncharacterized protein LOC132704371 n=1 Tax=Cylas formicarius TaxID=197179 RepID=UPI00295847C2|nr:uncharacterized protein LOC132704371 [Cylas formicarius]